MVPDIIGCDNSSFEALVPGRRGEVMGFQNFFKNKWPKFTSTLGITLALVVMFSTVALAIYIHKATLNTYIATAEEDFYFTSDLLTDAETIPTYQIVHDWETDDTATISFKLKNYYSPLNISNSNISYSITATVQEDNVNGPGGTITGKTKNEVLIELPVSKPASFDTKSTLPVMVTAASNSPYKKTLQGKFIITPAISCQMAENQESPVAILTITLAQSAELTRDVVITWPEGAAPDMTNPIVMAAVDANTIDLANKNLTTTLNTGAIYELVFFKDQGELNYTGVTVAGF
jgi:hypothetical protein